jgi:Bacterial Ig domain
MFARIRFLTVASLALAALWFGMPGFSGATYTATTGNSVSTVTAATDWTPPTVSMTAPGSTLTGTVTVAANASDATSGVASVAIQYAVSGGSAWTTLCTDTTSPYSCSWDTTLVTDGAYSLRAVAIDKATPSNTATSATISTNVGNTPVVTLTDPGSFVSGTVSVNAAITNVGSKAISSFKIQFSPAGANSWGDVPGCSTTTAILACSTSTSGTTGNYDVRAIAVVAGTTYTDVVTGVYIDNTAPTATMTNPGTSLSGTVTLAATASDADAGIASVAIQRAVNGTSTWTTVCTDTTTPYTCSFASTGVTDGSYDFRAVATDKAGNVTNSSTVPGITVNNSTASVTLADPGGYVGGTAVALSATASSTSTITNVVIQRSPAETGTWTTICTDTSSPYSCTWNTTSPLVSNGSYDLRAVLTDNHGITTTSSLQTTYVTNQALSASDVQTANKAGGTNGKIEAGDKMVLTYNGAVNTGSLLAGWDGTATAVSAKVVYGSSSLSTFSVTGVNLGSVALTGGYLGSGTLTMASSSMVASTTTVGGVTTTTVTITLTAPTGGTATVAGAAGNMIWSPSALATNVAGTASSTTPLTESGALDKDF